MDPLVRYSALLFFSGSGIVIGLLAHPALSTAAWAAIGALQVLLGILYLADTRPEPIEEEIPVHELHEFVPELPYFAKPENEATVDPAILRLDELIRDLPVDDVVRKLLLLRLSNAIVQVREATIAPARALHLIGETAISPFEHNLAAEDYLTLRGLTQAALDSVARQAGRFGGIQ